MNIRTRLIAVVLMFFCVAFVAQAKPVDCRSLEPKLKSGDLIFLSIDNIFFENVAKATNTWVNHVGIAFQSGDGWKVQESRVPFSTTADFCDYIGRAGKGQVAILRLKGERLNSQQLEALWQATENRMGVLYHQGFDLDSSRQFCSKFVYEVFLEALGVELGEIQTFKQILDENPDGSLKFWKWWFLGDIPWERRTITPKSQLIDSDLETIWSWDSKN
jgi:hypothetical protein